ncbi:hypothetical protein EJB05_55264, partial [Eragrostis curvula]
MVTTSYDATRDLAHGRSTNRGELYAPQTNDSHLPHKLRDIAADLAGCSAELIQIVIQPLRKILAAVCTTFDLFPRSDHLKSHHPAKSKQSNHIHVRCSTDATHLVHELLAVALSVFKHLDCYFTAMRQVASVNGTIAALAKLRTRSGIKYAQRSFQRQTMAKIRHVTTVPSRLVGFVKVTCLAPLPALFRSRGVVVVGA